MNLKAMERLVPVGRFFFAIAPIVWGIQHLVYGDFVTRVVLSWPSWIPGRLFWAYLVGAWLVVSGLAILSGKAARTMSLVLGGMLLLSFVFLSLPTAARDAPWGGGWTSALKTLTVSGGAFVVAGSLPAQSSRSSGGLSPLLGALEALIPIGRFCLAVFMVLCGIQHFIWRAFVVRLVPAWLPPTPMFWTFFTGVALIAGGVGLTVRKTLPLAATLSGLMIFSWVFLVHIRLVVIDPVPNETTALFEALAFSGIAFILAGMGRSPIPRLGLAPTKKASLA